MAYLPTPVTEWTAPGHPGTHPSPYSDQNPILELGNVRRHGGTLQSGAQRQPWYRFVHDQCMHECMRTDRAHFLIRLQIHRAELATLHS
jgi:hypothetical protein